MLKFFASDVVVSKGSNNNPAVKISDKGDFARFRIGAKIYDTRAENNHRWVNLTVKCFDPTLVERIRKMGLKEGSHIALSGRYDEDVWEDEQTKTKKSMPVIILDELEYCFSGSSKSSGDGNKATAAPQNPMPNYAAAPADGAMNGGFTGYQPYGGGNSFFNIRNL